MDSTPSSMPERSPSKFVDQLRVLVDHEVEFIVVGGVAAVLAGAPIVTFDLDVVYERSLDNRTRLAAALSRLGAVYNDPAGRRLVPDAEKLATIRIHLLLTDVGGLDLLASIGDDLAYEDLLDRSGEYEVGDMRLRVLDLETVVETKEIADREKDRAVLPILRQTLAAKTESR